MSEVGDFRDLWVTVYRCPERQCNGYIEVADGRNIPILNRLDIGVLEKIQQAPREVMAAAVKQLKQVDYKTVSIVPFELVVLGIK